MQRRFISFIKGDANALPGDYVVALFGVVALMVVILLAS